MHAQKVPALRAAGKTGSSAQPNSQQATVPAGTVRGTHSGSSSSSSAALNARAAAPVAARAFLLRERAGVLPAESVLNLLNKWAPVR